MELIRAVPVKAPGKIFDVGPAAMAFVLSQRVRKNGFPTYDPGRGVVIEFKV